jgi:hypothetical protein
MRRRTIAHVGIGLMAALVLAVALLLTFARLPHPLLAISASGTAVVSIAGFRYYLTHRGPR